MSKSTVCKDCNGTGYFEWKLNPSFADGTRSTGRIKCGVCDIVDKREAAIATLESLGYEYNGGEQWESPITFGQTQRKTMEQLQRESNYRMSVQLEEAALAPTKTWDTKPSTTYSRLKDEIIKEYLAAQISELK